VNNKKPVNLKKFGPSIIGSNFFMNVTGMLLRFRGPLTATSYG